MTDFKKDNDTTKVEDSKLVKTNEQEITRELPVTIKDNPLINEYMELASIIVKSGLTPHKKPEDAAVAMLTGKELGFKSMVSLNNIHSINGRAGLGVHLIVAMLLKNGIRVEILKDFVPAESTTPNSSANGNDLLWRYTEVKFTRWFKNPDGTFDRIVTIMKYTMKEAQLAGLLEKDNWQKMPKIMLRTRCITLGARIAAPDVIMGMYEYSEIAEIEGKDKEIINNPEFTSAEIVDDEDK